MRKAQKRPSSLGDEGLAISDKSGWFSVLTNLPLHFCSRYSPSGAIRSINDVCSPFVTDLLWFGTILSKFGTNYGELAQTKSLTIGYLCFALENCFTNCKATGVISKNI